VFPGGRGAAGPATAMACQPASRRMVNPANCGCGTKPPHRAGASAPPQGAHQDGRKLSSYLSAEHAVEHNVPPLSRAEPCVPENSFTGEARFFQRALLSDVVDIGPRLDPFDQRRGE
jgi:hypothetical protein